jgi:cytidyltransferase-like protein
MRIVGIITEYNPFHNGHLYHIRKAKELTGADAVVVVMSGDFVQRGEPAIMPKRLRTRAALEAGASVVIELPVCYATGSAEYFATGAITLLDQLGCVDAICFGSECGDIRVLMQIAKVLADEPEGYRKMLQEYLRSGDAFPKARQKAIAEYMKAGSNTSVAEHVIETILEQPNNILGIEYLKALYRCKSEMKPYTIGRVASGYHEPTLQEEYEHREYPVSSGALQKAHGISSATAIRNAIKAAEYERNPGKVRNLSRAQNLSKVQKPELSELELHVPGPCMKILQEMYGEQYPVWAEDLSLLLKYRILTESKESLCQYLDVTEELANRIMNRRNEYISYPQFCERLKTKEMTYSRISRSLLHILLQITDADMAEYARAGHCCYARVLGFRKDDREVLTKLKKNTGVPLLTKLAKAQDILDDTGMRMLKKDVLASEVYQSILTQKYQRLSVNEYSQQIVQV